MGQIKTCLWFEKGGYEAAKFYVDLIPNSRLTGENLAQTENGEPLVVNFELDGVPYQILNGGPHFKLSEAVSVVYRTDNQTDLDRVYNALLGEKGVEMQCGWLRDQFGLTWQVIPDQLIEALSSDDRAASERAQTAMLNMKRINIHGIMEAFNG